MKCLSVRYVLQCDIPGYCDVHYVMKCLSVRYVLQCDVPGDRDAWVEVVELGRAESNLLVLILSTSTEHKTVCLSVTYIGPKSRTERPRKTKIVTEVAKVTRDSDTTFKVKRSKVNLQGAGHVDLPHSLLPNTKCNCTVEQNTA